MEGGHVEAIQGMTLDQIGGKYYWKKFHINPGHGSQQSKSPRHFFIIVF